MCILQGVFVVCTVHFLQDDVLPTHMHMHIHMHTTSSHIYTHKQQVQEHSFNTPFQLADPQRLPGCDRPQGGLDYSTRLQRGDVVVAGSDGLFDNMWDIQLAELVTAAIRCV